MRYWPGRHDNPPWFVVGILKIVKQIIVGVIRSSSRGFIRGSALGGSSGFFLFYYCQIAKHVVLSGRYLLTAIFCFRLHDVTAACGVIWGLRLKEQIIVVVRLKEQIVLVVICQTILIVKVGFSAVLLPSCGIV